MSSHPNVLLVGPAAATAPLLQALHPHLRQPLSRCDLRVDTRVPEPTEGTLVISELDRMDPVQQRQLVAWLNQRQSPVQVVCTTSEPIFALVVAGQFRSDLYYRLNAVFLDVTPMQ
jgi:DNA-binding NtrC family response regulator